MSNITRFLLNESEFKIQVPVSENHSDFSAISLFLSNDLIHNEAAMYCQQWVGALKPDRPNRKPSPKMYSRHDLGWVLLFFEPYLPHLRKQRTIPTLAHLLLGVSKVKLLFVEPDIMSRTFVIFKWQWVLISLGSCMHSGKRMCCVSTSEL